MTLTSLRDGKATLIPKAVQLPEFIKTRLTINIYRTIKLTYPALSAMAGILLFLYFQVSAERVLERASTSDACPFDLRDQVHVTLAVGRPDEYFTTI